MLVASGGLLFGPASHFSLPHRRVTCSLELGAYRCRTVPKNPPRLARQPEEVRRAAVAKIAQGEASLGLSANACTAGGARALTHGVVGRT
jgi:hypothetical protein